MGIAETFYILFKSNSDDLVAGNERAEKSTKKIQKELTATGQLSDKVGKSFGGLIGAAARAFIAIAGTAALIGSARAAVNYADGLGELSEALNIDIEKLSVWGDAVKRSGGTAEGFFDTLKTATASLQEFATKGTSRTAPFFQALNIRMTDSKGKVREFIDILPELADRFSQIGKQEAFGLGQKLGLDRGTIMLLQKGRIEVDALIRKQKELGIVTKEDAALSAKFNDQLDDTSHAFRTISLRLGLLIIPSLTSLFNKLEIIFVFFSKHKDLAVGAIIGIAGAITAYMLPALVRIGVANVIAFAPFYAVAGVIAAVGAAIALVYEDIQHYLAGQKSLIGYLFEKFPTLKTVIEAVGKSISWFLESLLYTGKFILQVWDDVTGTLRDAIGIILDFLGLLGKAYTKIKQVFTKNKSIDINSTIAQTGNAALASANNLPFSQFSTSNILNSASKSLSRNITVQTGKIEIVTNATDAVGVADSLGDSLKTAIRQAMENADDGVAI